ncbi:MAG: 50S ribosomal protein L4, partial [Spirochaetia bacterium]|nr:50S ribosomal protein L4 [Spirochaetia bacterium]
KISILEDLILDKFSSKAVYTIFKNMGLNNTGFIAILVTGEDEKLKISTRNIPHVKYINAKRVGCRELLFNNNLVITESALQELVSHYKEVLK